MMKKTLGILIGIMMLSLGVMAQIKVKGTVTDADTGEPLLGVIVLQKGTKVGCVTDMDGTYEINAAGEESVLQFKAVGKEDIERKVEKNTVINVSLKDSEEEKEGVKVYASDKEKVYIYDSENEEKQLFTTSGTVVVEGAEKDNDKTLIYIDGERVDMKIDTVIDKAQVSISKFNVINGKEKSIVTISTNPEKINAIRVRSINENPLIVVDGTPLRGNSINKISPDSIESITVLKGNSAKAIYGEKGKNGVILIVTKNPMKKTEEGLVP